MCNVEAWPAGWEQGSRPTTNQPTDRPADKFALACRNCLPASTLHPPVEEDQGRDGEEKASRKSTAAAGGGGRVANVRINMNNMSCCTDIML